MASAERARRRVSLHVDIDERASGPGLLIDGERATSAASSSLDPYYFGLATGQANSSKPVTPDVPRAYEPVTPAKDAATIDRRGLVGVGELTTPRWVKQSSTETNDHDHDSDDLPDSPWTIEAVDGELDDPEDLKDQTMPPQPQSLRGQPSLTSESGGEEIVYPRAVESQPPMPPSAFSSQPRRARKRTSDEFEMDQHGSLTVPKSRKHMSLGARPLTSPRDSKTATTKRRESAGLTLSTNRHTHNPSKRGHTDFSHLPPSPSASSVKQFLKQSRSPATKESHAWSGLDDEATAEALRKLDGLSGKSARARASVGSFHRSSRPVTPAKSTGSGTQWEGVEPAPSPMKRKSSLKDVRPKDQEQATETANDSTPGTADDQTPQPPSTEKTPKRSSVRSSINGKRTSASSTNYTGTPTTSSRDSTSMSASTSVTTPSSSRHSISKSKRNSAGSDISNSSDAEEHDVPPVPPLPKDLDKYKSPPPSAATLSFPPIPDPQPRLSNESQPDTAGLASETSSIQQSRLSISSNRNRLSQQLTPDAAVSGQTAPVKTPSKKWSFTNALKLSSSPSSSKRESALSPRSVTFGHQLKSSSSRDQVLSPSDRGSKKPSWPQSDAMSSAASLASISSIGSSSRAPASSVERASRTGTESSSSNHGTTLTTSQNPSSPTSSVRRGQSKRLTPSSIPFFRRSSSQSIQLSNSATYAGPTSPSQTSTHQFPSSIRGKGERSMSPENSQLYLTSPTVPATATRKSSIISLGLPSLLKSSSRRSLHAESKEQAKEMLKAREKEKEKEKEREKEKEKINLERGKTLSSTEPRKPKSPVAMPPMQVAALEPATAQRVARLKSNASSSSSSSSSKATPVSRVTSQTLSSMQKQSDASLRSGVVRSGQLPTIAGSPSVGTVGHSKESSMTKESAPPSSLSNSASGLPKETPTKIPRISSRTSGISSPSIKSTLPRRSSVNTSSTSVNANSSSSNSSPTINEFGVMENSDSPSKTLPTSNSTLPRAKVTNSMSGSILPRKNRESLSSFAGLRKSSTGSTASATTSNTASTSHHRFSALSPSKGLKLLSPKISLQSTRNMTGSSSTSGIQERMTMSPSSSRQSLTTPSPSPNLTDDDERLGDEEMMAYIRRQQQKKLNAGATQADLDKLLEFPEPIAPTPPLSAFRYFERQEILEYPNVYFLGQRSRKKMATLDNTHNNHGYDDERGDYLVVPRDHLAYRYEVIDTLGKGSFDHCTGESVAIKIIRNKKRFHHQALVEIKILDNLRKWDAEEKHYVIKMTDHFYFRNHLCIAMELLSINLYELIKANGFVGFTTNLIRRFTTQMLMSLTLMRHHRIVHCDLKPENVLLRHPAKSGIKVIDFGSSCLEHEKIYTYIQSRFYRSPEVILGMNYHMAIDMWSLGCILAELYTGFPIFPGEMNRSSLSCIMEVLGAPDRDFVNKSSRKKLFFDASGAPRAVVNSKGRRRRPGTKTLAQVLRCSDEDFVDFIGKCLMWDPERRIKPQAALRHPFPQSTPSKNMMSSSSLVGSRSSKHILATPKKSEIGAPTPLTARTTRTTTNGNGPTTPSSSSHNTSFRGPQSSRTVKSMVT
ncbi:hypothetical protein DL96DRAFT_1598956 [Flagelloscypha sp. PMI_526]|nr:hypothetical protein DL96DRAFT_1598956 [Flagelloscypha sp. PMI_526]